MTVALKTTQMISLVVIILVAQIWDFLDVIVWKEILIAALLLGVRILSLIGEDNLLRLMEILLI